MTILSTEHASDGVPPEVHGDGAPPELPGDGGVERLRFRFRSDRKLAGTIMRAAIDRAPSPLDGSASNSSVLLPVPRASVTMVVNSSSVGFWLTTLTEGVDIVRPPPAIATFAVVAYAGAAASAHAAIDTSPMHRRVTMHDFCPLRARATL